jgi:hypothetical protein
MNSLYSITNEHVLSTVRSARVEASLGHSRVSRTALFQPGSRRPVVGRSRANSQFGQANSQFGQATFPSGGQVRQVSECCCLIVPGHGAAWRWFPWPGTGLASGRSGGPVLPPGGNVHSAHTAGTRTARTARPAGTRTARTSRPAGMCTARTSPRLAGHADLPAAVSGTRRWLRTWPRCSRGARPAACCAPWRRRTRRRGRRPRRCAARGP